MLFQADYRSFWVVFFSKKKFGFQVVHRSFKVVVFLFEEKRFRCFEVKLFRIVSGWFFFV